MLCTLCKTGELEPGFATVTLERAGSVVVFKLVPARVCQNCGDYQLSADVAEQLYDRAEAAIAKGAEIEVSRWRLAS